MYGDRDREGTSGAGQVSPATGQPASTRGNETVEPIKQDIGGELEACDTDARREQREQLNDLYPGAVTTREIGQVIGRRSVGPASDCARVDKAEQHAPPFEPIDRDLAAHAARVALTWFIRRPEAVS